MPKVLRRFLIPLAYFSNNLVSRIGIFLVTAATVLWIFAIPTFLLGRASNPYAGILLLLILPACFFLGLALIPLGVIGRRRAASAAGWALPEKIDFGSPRVRSVAWFVAGATVVNLAIGSQFTYSAVNYMDGTSFCGTTCHVMQPEFTAFSGSSHKSVECVRCHAGPGAAGFAKSKMAGVHQLVDTLLGRFERPVHPLNPPLRGAETCELCHARSTDHGDKLRTMATFASDEANKRSDTVMVVHAGRIHSAHLGVGVQIDYLRDPTDAAAIRLVRYSKKGQAAVTYSPSGAGAAAGNAEDFRSMDCVDCHNRIAHAAAAPDAAVDQALLRGEIPASIPFIKRQAVKVLREAKSEAALVTALRQFYAKSDKPVAEPMLTSAVNGVSKIWREHVFPELNTSWDTHSDQMGHTNAPGCFRCHDGEHKATGGAAITQDCEACHHISALEESRPKILDDLGMAQAQ